MTNHFWRYWFPVLLWAMLIFTVSSVSDFPASVEQLWSFDELLHAAEYGVLAFLLARALKNSQKDQLKHNFRFLAVLFAVLYAASDELHQSVVPLRSASIVDFIFDGIGAVLGQMFFRE